MRFCKKLAELAHLQIFEILYSLFLSCSLLLLYSRFPFPLSLDLLQSGCWPWARFYVSQVFSDSTSAVACKVFPRVLHLYTYNINCKIQVSRILFHIFHSEFWDRIAFVALIISRCTIGRIDEKKFVCAKF